MKYPIQEIISDVRKALDENSQEESLAAVGDVDTLMLDEIIESKIEDGARVVENSAPHHLLDSGRVFGDSVEWSGKAGYGSGSIHLPDDFLRLAVFQMSDWAYAVTEPIYQDNPLYAQQHSRFAGVRGNTEAPVVAIVLQPIGHVLEFYSCSAGADVYVKYARYIPIPKIRNEEIELCEKLKPAIIYYIAHLVAQTLNNADLAEKMLSTAKSIAELN